MLLSLNQAQTKITPRTRTAFQKDLVAWYRRHARALPWRMPPGAKGLPDPYAVVVSELMLQQTQVATVRPYYQRWMARFPDWKTLARARIESVLRAWEGLGYYTRARNLHALARWVVTEGKGGLPGETDALKKLPGIGPYTAGAIASIAFNQRAALVDGNVIRILARVFNFQEEVNTPAAHKFFWQLAEQLLPEKNCGDYNQALMDLGATVCTANPQCLLCPLQSVCQAPEPAALPIRSRPQVTQLAETIGLIADPAGARWWCEQIPANAGRWPGLWRFPLWNATTMRRLDSAPAYESAYTITRYRVCLRAWRAEWVTPPSVGQWLDSAQMMRRPFAAPYRKLASSLLARNVVPRALIGVQ